MSAYVTISKTQDRIVRGIFYTGFAVAIVASTVAWGVKEILGIKVP